MEEVLYKMQNSPVDSNPELLAAIEEHTAKRSKKMEKKMKKYFAVKLETIE